MTFFREFLKLQKVAQVRKGKAAAFLKAFPKASIEKLQDQNKKRSMGINKIIERLGITIVQSPVDATDGSF